MQGQRGEVEVVGPRLDLLREPGDGWEEKGILHGEGRLSMIFGWSKPCVAGRRCVLDLGRQPGRERR